MRKLFLTVFILLSLITFSYAADYTTTHYRMLVPEEGTVDWNSKLSNDIISMDNIMYMVSQDLGVTSKKIKISDDATTTIGGSVGRIRLISADGSVCYIPVYAGS